MFPRSRWPDAAAARRFPFERIADFAASACAEHLAGDVRRLFKRNVLDSIGYAIAALPGSPFHALRKQFEEYRAPERRTLGVNACERDASQWKGFAPGWTGMRAVYATSMAKHGFTGPLKQIANAISITTTGGKTSVDQAALFNSGLTRYVDLLDSGPADNLDRYLSIIDGGSRSGAFSEAKLLHPKIRGDRHDNHESGRSRCEVIAHVTRCTNCIRRG